MRVQRRYKHGSNVAINIAIRNISDMEYFARLVLNIMLEHNIAYLLCSGEYGVGKTTLIRYLVNVLVHEEHIEVASPSFTTYNLYPTFPPCVHIDLYATRRSLDDIMEEVGEIPSPLICVEWADTMTEPLDEPYIACHLSYESCEARSILCSSLYPAAIREIEHQYTIYEYGIR